MGTLLQTIAQGLTLGAQYALVSLGFTMSFGILGVVNFAHGALYVVGGYVAYAAVTHLGLPFGVGVVVALLVTGAIGYVFELTVIEKRVDDHLATIILTAGFSLLISGVLLIVFGAQPKPFEIPVKGTVSLAGVILPTARLIIIGMGVVGVAALYGLLYRTELGRALRAMAGDREIAVAQGMRPRVLFPLAFAIATGLVGLTGAMVMPVFSVDPFQGDHMLTTAFLAVIVGGLGSLPGAVIAAVLIGMIEAFSNVYIGPSIAELVLFVVILVVLVVRPTGLMGGRVRDA
jgi:branched-chain amino acid transport system permease protein